MTVLSKARRYADEIGHCWRLGATIPDRTSLALDTLSFHLQNAKGNLSSSSDEAIRKCRIRLPGDLRSIDFSYRIRGGDLFIFHEVLLDRCYQIPPELLTSPVKTVVDLGGNIGSATLSMAARFPGASFVCLEPNPGNARVLESNLAWLGNRARVVEGAISDTDGFADFAVTGVAWEGHLGGGGPNHLRVRCYRLETLLDEMKLDRVDVLKVDVEGAEAQLFATRTEAWNRVGLIIVELHNHYGFKEFQSDMNDIGFRAIASGSQYGNVMPMAVRRN